MKALDQILYWASVNYHPLYEQYLVEEYEKQNGKHYNEATAIEVVERMTSADADGTEREGEHWSVEQVKTATQAMEFPSGTTCWDKYVALNSWWHDMRQEFGTDAALIRAGVRFYFEDEDAPDGKVWIYQHAMDAEM